MKNTAILLFTALLFIPHLVTADETPIQLPPISVTPGRFGIHEGTTLLNELSREEMEYLPLIDNDVFRAAQIFPGVVSNDFSARFEVRGGEKDETAVRLDGLELYEPFHLQDFGGAISSIDLGIIGRADLLTGGFPAEYGDRMSAVYEITTRNARRDRVHANLGIDLLNLHAILEGPLGKGSWLFSARRGYIDWILKLMGSDEELNPRYTDVFIKLDQPLSDKDTLILESLIGLDENEIHEEGTDLLSEYRNRIGWLRWRRLWQEQVFSDLFLFVGHMDQDKREGDFLNTASVPASMDKEGEHDERVLDYMGWQMDVNARWHDSHTTKWGIIWRWSDVFYDYFFREAGDVQPIRSRVDSDGWDWDLRSYIQDEWQVTQQIALNAGVRWLYQHENASSSIAPRLVFAIRPNPNWILRAAWGIYHQPVDRLHLPVESGQPYVDRPEEAEHWIFSAEYQPTEEMFLRVEGYYKPMDHLVGFIRDAGRKSQQFLIPDRGKAWGAELFGIRRFSEQFSVSLGYAYSVAQASIGDQTFNRDSDQRHSFSLIGHYALSDTTSLYFNWRFHTGTPYTEAQYRLEDDRWIKSYGEINGNRLPPYHSLDVRLTKEATYRRWHLQWYLQILNLYNRNNLHEYSYEEILSLSGEVQGYEKVEEPLLPIVPTLGVNVTF